MTSIPLPAKRVRRKVKAFTRRQRHAARLRAKRDAAAVARAERAAEKRKSAVAARKYAVFTGYSEKVREGNQEGWVKHPGCDPARTLALIGEES